MKPIAAGLCFIVALALVAGSAWGQAEQASLEELRAAVFAKQDRGDLLGAIQAAMRVVTVTEQRTGKESRETALAIGVVAKLQRNAGLVEQSDQQMRRKIALFEKLSGPNSLDYAKALLELGGLNLDAGRLRQAEAPLRKSLELARTLLAGHPDLAYFYNQVGRLDMEQGKSSEAESMLQKALEIRQTAQSLDPMLLATSQDNLGSFYLRGQRFAEAGPHLEEALRLFKASLGSLHPDTLICVANLADLYAGTERMPQAVELLTAVLTALPAEGRGSAKVDLLRQRGKLYARQEEFAAAQADFGRAVALASQDSRSSAKLVDALLDQASMSKTLSTPEVGEALLDRAQAVLDAQASPNRSTLTNIWALRGWFQWQLRNMTEATDNLTRVVDYARTDDPAGLPNALLNLAMVQSQANLLEVAEANARESLKLMLARSKEGVDLAECYNVLGSILERRDQPGPAETHYKRALAILQRARPSWDPRVVNVQSNLGLLFLQTARPTEALAFAQLRASAFEDRLLKLLSRGGEEEARAYVHDQNPLSIFASIGQAVPLARAVFNYQGVVTDAVVALHASQGSPSQREAFGRWRDARAALTQWTVTHPTGDAATGDRLSSDLVAAQAAFASIAGREGPVARFDVRVEDVARRIPSDAALINYVRYTRYLGRGLQEDRYGALVMTRDATPRWVPLDKAADLEGVAGVYERAVRGRDPVNSLSNVLQSLHARLLAPVLGQLPAQVTQLLVVPDGEINFISLAALADSSGVFVGEKYSISYLASSRALLQHRGSEAGGLRNDVRIYADPVFRAEGRSAPAASVPKGSKGLLYTPGFEPTELKSLPFTGVEAAAIQRVAAQSGWHATLVNGSRASERDVKAMAAPGILHLATHGLWLSRFGTELTPPAGPSRGVAGVDPLSAPAPRRSVSAPAQRSSDLAQAWREGHLTKVEVLSANSPAFDSPMLRSVVALSGAQETLDGWRAGKVRPGVDDGVLTAEEASMLDLRGTWLVTLSSCDSGSGEPEPGEGVVGLRRGFIEAGAQNVLTTLWPVSDALTPQLMTDFYTDAMKTRDASKALASAQRRMLTRLRTQHGVEAAARLVGAFVLISNGGGQQ